MTTASDALCVCGHPRHRHETVNEMYPAMCGHADPISVDADDERRMDSICWCLEFRPEFGGILRDHG